MKLREPLLKYLQKQELKKCWRCGNDLGATNLDERLPEIECPTCGLVIAVRSKYNRLMAWLFLATLTAFGFGVGIGFILGG